MDEPFQELAAAGRNADGSYRASYDLRWIVEEGVIVGLRFTELGRGSRFDGRYRD